MNVTIIGCGYVGMAVAHHWRWNLGYFVTATTTTQERLMVLEKVAQRGVVIQGNDEKTLHTLLQNQEAVLLSVAPIGNHQADADIYEKTYLHTARNLTTALKQIPSLKQLIYTGSCAVYGNSDGTWLSEASPIVPADRNAEILHETEQVLLSALSENLQVCIFRLGAIYGPQREIKKRFANLAGTTRPGSGTHFTNWVHLDDIVSATEFALSHRLQGIYNLVNDVPLTAYELFEQMSQRYNLPKVEWDAALPRSRENNRRVSNQKLKTEGYCFIHPELEI